MNNKRKPFATSNKYQVRIVLLTFFPCFLLFAAFAGINLLMMSEISSVIMNHSPAALARQVCQWSGAIVFILCAIFVLSLVIISFRLLFGVVSGLGI